MNRNKIIQSVFKGIENVVRGHYESDIEKMEVDCKNNMYSSVVMSASFLQGLSLAFESKIKVKNSKIGAETAKQWSELSKGGKKLTPEIKNQIKKCSSSLKSIFETGVNKISLPMRVVKLPTGKSERFTLEELISTIKKIKKNAKRQASNNKITRSKENINKEVEKAKKEISDKLAKINEKVENYDVEIQQITRFNSEFTFTSGFLDQIVADLRDKNKSKAEEALALKIDVQQFQGYLQTIRDRLKSNYSEVSKKIDDIYQKVLEGKSIKDISNQIENAMPRKDKQKIYGICEDLIGEVKSEEKKLTNKASEFKKWLKQEKKRLEKEKDSINKIKSKIDSEEYKSLVKQKNLNLEDKELEKLIKFIFAVENPDYNNNADYIKNYNSDLIDDYKFLCNKKEVKINSYDMDSKETEAFIKAYFETVEYFNKLNGCFKVVEDNINLTKEKFKGLKEKFDGFLEKTTDDWNGDTNTSNELRKLDGKTIKDLQSKLKGRVQVHCFAKCMSKILEKFLEDWDNNLKLIFADNQITQFNSCYEITKNFLKDINPISKKKFKFRETQAKK